MAKSTNMKKEKKKLKKPTSKTKQNFLPEDEMPEECYKKPKKK